MTEPKRPIEFQNTMRVCGMVLFVAFGIGLRFFWIWRQPWLIGDAAVYGLMAKHIAELREFPIFVWGAHYSGTLSMYIAAVLFKCFGVSAIAFRCLDAAYSCLFVLANLFLARRVLGRCGWFASLALALYPPVKIFDLSLLDRQYGEVLVLGSLLIWFSVALMRSEFPFDRRYLYLGGFVSGLGMWLTPNVVPFVLIFFGVLWVKDRRIFLKPDFIPCILLFLIGYFPVIIYNHQHPMAQLYRMVGRMLEVDRAILNDPHWKTIVFLKALSRLASAPMIFFRLPQMILSLYGVGPSLALGAAVAWGWRNNGRAFWKWGNGPEAPLLSFVLCFVLYYSIMAAPNYAPRYTLLLYVVFPVLFSKLLMDIERMAPNLARAVLALLLIFNVSGTVYALSQKSEDRYEQLTEWLQARGVTRGYSDYWTAYPVIFDSKENILISPTLIHPTMEDRWPEYTVSVRASPSAAVIIDSVARPCAAAIINSTLSELGYQRARVGSFEVFYGAPHGIDPASLRLFERCTIGAGSPGA